MPAMTLAAIVRVVVMNPPQTNLARTNPKMIPAKINRKMNPILITNPTITNPAKRIKSLKRKPKSYIIQIFSLQCADSKYYDIR